MSQSANIFAWLADGNTITPLQAYEKFGTLSLHTRIDQLRAKGIKIHCEMITVGDKRVGCYSIEEERYAYG